jgi:hypothetical protein
MRREDELREDGLLPPLPEVEDDGDDEMVTRGGENLREISWIWTMAGTAGTDEEIQDGGYSFWETGIDFIDKLSKYSATY